MSFKSLQLTGDSFLGAFAKLRKATITFVTSVRPSAWNNSAPIGQFFYDIRYLRIFRISVKKIKVSLKCKKITKGTSHEDQYIFIAISHSFLLRMRNVSDKSCTENQNTHFLFSNFFFFENRAFYGNVEKHSTAGSVTDDNMAHANCILDN